MASALGAEITCVQIAPTRPTPFAPTIFMSKYLNLKDNLEKHGTAKMKVFGHSMTPIIQSGSLLTFKKEDAYEIGDVVFSKVKGRWIDAHKITKKSPDKGYMIANNHGWENGWTNQVFARVIEVNGIKFGR